MTVDVNKLPEYTHKEEVFNSLSHLTGFLFGLATLIFFIVHGIINNLNTLYMLPFYIYSLCMMLVFFVSSFYHSSPFSSKKRAYSRVVDHCDIYAFVAATYLPICVHGIENKSVALAIMIIEVSLMILGILLNALPINNKFVRIITYLIYIIDGWVLIIFFPFNIGLSFNVFIFILIGGIVYSIGAIIYAFGKRKHWFHTIFHFFVLFAAIIQFIGIYFLF